MIDRKKEENVMKDGEFLFRKSFYESCQEIDDPRLRLIIYEAICEYGVTGKNNWKKYSLTDKEQNIINIILKPIYFSIDSTKERYKRAVENGRKGGLKGGKLGGRGHKKNADIKSANE